MGGVVAALYLLSATGCSQIVQVPKDDALRQKELKDATVRTRTGDVYFFETASVIGDSLSGTAQERRTVYLEDGDSREVVDERAVRVALTDVEDLSVRKKSWKRVGLWSLAAAGVAGAIAVAASQNSGTSSGGGSGGGKPPGPTP
jgi:hypothetical protein